MAQQMIDGQKAGSGSARQPVIAPDSASSVTKLKIAVGLSEGEIEGFTRADVKLDGTPLTELSSDIVCDYRFGTNDQEYIPGIDEVANEIGVGVELRGNTDWVKLITNQDIDHVGIRLRWGLLQTSHSNGDVTGVSIIYEIYIAPVGGSYERVLSTTLSDKTSDSYERYHEFKLPESNSGWMVRVVRVTPSAQSSLVSDKMYVQAYSEIIKSKFTFPYTSLVYLEYDAKTFSNVAKVAVKAKGLIIKVPSNYDLVTRQYSGMWSGTFKMAYTNNPAWVYYDLVTNPRYGCGDRIDSSMVDKWSLYKLGQYCDQMVDDGYGGLEPRFTCNVYLQSKERAYDILNRLTGLFRAINFWNGSQLVVDADIPQDTSYLYTNANVVDGLFEYAGTAATDLYSAAKVAWDNPANGYNTEYEAVSYEHLVKKLGFKTLELDAWGCTSRGQALRAGRWALLAESDTVTFKVGMDGYLAMPGKIIEIQDEFYAGKSNGGRVISIDPSRKVITLDRPVTTIPGDTISFNTALEGIKKYNIVSSAGSVVTVSESIDTSIENMHIWAINSSQLATQKYRILTVKYDGVGEFTISAVEYNPNKYEEIDSNIKFDEPPTSIINPVVQAAVKNVTITPSDFIYQGLNTVNLEIKWDRAENAVEYLVELKKDDGSWLKLPVTGNNSITLENVYAGAYIARVIAVSAFELKSLPAYSIKTRVSGKLSAPQSPTNLRSASIMFGAEFYWDFPLNSADTAVSRVAISYVEPGLDVDESTLLIYDKAYSDNKIVIQNLDIGTTVWVKVKLIDKLGFESPYTDWVSGQPSQDVDKVLDLISGHISESTLDQILKGKIDGAGALAGEAQLLASQANAAASNAQNTATQASIKAREASDAVVQEAINRAAALQAGISQVTTDYIAADSVIYGELNAYKASNDSAVATVVQKAESAVATGMTNSQSITELTGQVQAINNTKLDASVISNYYTKGQADDKSAEIAAGKIESYDANLVIGGANLLKNSNFEGELGSSNWSANDWGSNWVKQQDAVHGTVLKCITGSLIHDWISVEEGSTLAYSALVKTLVDRSMHLATPLHCWAGKDNTQQNLYEVLKKSHVVIPAGVWTKIWVVIKLTGDANSFRPFIYDTWPLDGFEIAWTKLEKGNKVTDWTPNNSEVQQSINANASAIQSTNADVSRIDGAVTSQASSISSLQSSLSDVDTKANTAINNAATAQQTANTAVTKADATAVIAQNLQASLDNTNANIATNYYTKSSTDQAIAAASNQLSSSFNTAINDVGVITDTRYENQPPSWYWANHPHRTEKEFKYSGNLGIPQATVDTLGVLETTVPWSDSSGGAIQQRFTWNDSAYALTRYSISQNEWSAWVSALNDIKNTVNTKLDASIISNYYTKAEADNVIAGKVEQFSSSVLTSNENLFKGNILYVYKVYAPGITTFNYTDYWVLDIAAGNGNYISLGLGVSPQTLNNNGLYYGYVTVSMDYMIEGGDAEALPHMYFGHGYQTFIHATNGPHSRGKWYRIYTTFYTGPSNLLVDPHLGVGHMSGRICIRNLKVERGGMTAYSVDVRETTQSINGIEAVKTVTIDNNGVMSGYGLISELKNGQVTSSFGVNADTFFIGAPSGGKKPFIQRNEWSAINGVWVPPGTYIDTAYIGNSTIGTAHINDLAVTTAKIGDGQITTAKIGDLQVDTLKIKDNAVTVPVALNDETVRSYSGTYNSHSYGNPNQVLADVASIFGDLATISINRNGGKCRVDASVTIATVPATTTRNGGYISGVTGSMYCGIILYRNGTPVKYFKVSAPFTKIGEINTYSGTLVMPIFLDDAATGSTTYTIRFGVSTTAAGGAIQIHPATSGYGTATVVSSSIALIELRK